jgi:hypothetical protein
VDLFEDDEEIHRRENQDLSFSPAGVSSFTNSFIHDENDQQNRFTNAKLFEFMQNLFNSPDGTRGIPLGVEVDNIQNLWSMNRPQRRALYRFWLRTYAQKIKGRTIVTRNRMYLCLRDRQRRNSHSKYIACLIVLIEE